MQDLLKRSRYCIASLESLLPGIIAILQRTLSIRPLAAGVNVGAEALRLKNLYRSRMRVVRYKSMVPIPQRFDGFDVPGSLDILDKFDNRVVPVLSYDSRHLF